MLVTTSLTICEGDEMGPFHIKAEDKDSFPFAEPFTFQLEKALEGTEKLWRLGESSGKWLLIGDYHILWFHLLARFLLRMEKKHWSLKDRQSFKEGQDKKLKLHSIIDTLGAVAPKSFGCQGLVPLRAVCPRTSKSVVLHAAWIPCVHGWRLRLLAWPSSWQAINWCWFLVWGLWTSGLSHNNRILKSCFEFLCLPF